MANPFDQFDTAPAPAPQPQGGFTGFIPGAPAPKTPPAQTPTQAELDRLAVIRRQQEIEDARRDRERDVSDGSYNKDIEDFSKRFSGEESVKAFTSILPQFASALRAEDTKAGDLNLIYAFGKIMDPGSVVREGELTMVQDTGALGDRLRGMLSEVDGRGRLSPNTRRALLNELRNRGSALADSYNQVRGSYAERARAYGFDPELALGPHPALPFQQAEADFLGRPIRNLDGSQGAAPRDTGATSMGGGGGSTSLSVDVSYDKMPWETEEQYRERAARDAPAPPMPEGWTGEIPEAVRRQMEAERFNTLRKQKLSETPGADDLLLHGAMLGLGDEASGVGYALNNALSAPFTDTDFDPAGAYQIGNRAEDMWLEEARRRAGAAGTAAEIGGSLLSGNVSNALASAPTLLGRVAQGSKAGAVGGGIAGFGYGEGDQSVPNALLGAGIGAGAGAALPVVGQVVGNRIEGLRRLTGKDPQLPRRIVGEAIEADGNSPRAVGQMMDEARGRGSPIMLADTGDNTRALLASVGRQPGPAKKLAREAVIERQKAQFERVVEAVKRDLGPTVNLREKGEELIEAARTAAGPLYKQAYEAPGASAIKLDDLANRPSVRLGMRNAVKLAQEEGRDPTALGFDFNEAGDVVLTRVPSWETLDLVKRGLDDVLEGYRDKVTGKLVLDGAGRATLSTLKTFLARADKINPAYKAARAAYEGPAKLRGALEQGSKVLGRSPDDILAQLKGFGSDAEREMYRMGVRKALVDRLAGKSDTSDKINALIGTPKLRSVLTRVFGGKGEFNRFIATLEDERLMQDTYKAVATGSPTAERMAADATTNDAGLAETAVDAALRGGGDTMWSALVAAIQKLREVDRFGAGKAGESTRESIAALLSETDPAVLQELIDAVNAAAQRQAVQAANRSKSAVRFGGNAGELSGMSIGQAYEPTN